MPGSISSHNSSATAHNDIRALVSSHDSRITSLEEAPTSAPRDSLTALYLSDYAPEGGTESASAGLRAAFDALGAQGGGELVVDGTFLLDQNSIQLGEGASKNFNGLANTIVLRGQGSHSVLLLRAGASATALRISTIENLYIENVTFHGSPSAIPDVRKGIYLDGVRTATFIGCNFNAIVAGNGYAILEL